MMITGMVNLTILFIMVKIANLGMSLGLRFIMIMEIAIFIVMMFLKLKSVLMTSRALTKPFVWLLLRRLDDEKKTDINPFGCCTCGSCIIFDYRFYFWFLGVVDIMNIPDNLKACDDPASDVEVVVICDQGGCMNQVIIGDDEASNELSYYGGVTCSACIDFMCEDEL
jgi:hypothetical protein